MTPVRTTIGVELPLSVLHLDRLPFFHDMAQVISHDKLSMRLVESEFVIPVVGNNETGFGS